MSSVSIKLSYIFEHLRSSNYKPVSLKLDKGHIVIFDGCSGNTLIVIKDYQIESILIKVNESPIIFSWAGLKCTVEDDHYEEEF